MSRSTHLTAHTDAFPTTIMQTWKNRDVPIHWQESPDSIHRHMDNWNYVLMTDATNLAFVEEHFPEFVDVYNGLDYPIQRADMIRYMWLYVHGGVYLDLDIVVTKPLDDLFTSSCEIYLVHSGNIQSYYTNALMASRKNSSFWLDCLDEIRTSVRQPSSLWVGRHLWVMNTTGPMMLSRVAQRTRLVIGTLPSILLVPCSICELPCQGGPDIYAYAIPGSSWVTWDSHLYTFLLCRWQEVAWGFGLVIILIILMIIWLCRR